GDDVTKTRGRSRSRSESAPKDSPKRRSPSPPSMLHVSNLTRNVKADHLKVT
ncbi:unnamed protein product, partial [Ascophyllum nodosum]